jgi:hypothetical protein
LLRVLLVRFCPLPARAVGRLLLVIRAATRNSALSRNSWDWLNAILSPHEGSPREAKLLGGDGGKRAVLRKSAKYKAIAQGRPECFRQTCSSCALLLYAYCTRDRGCGEPPVFLAPFISMRANEDANLGQNMSRDREVISPSLRTSPSVRTAPAGETDSGPGMIAPTHPR